MQQNPSPPEMSVDTEKETRPRSMVERVVSGINKTVGELSGIFYFIVFVLCLLEISLRFFFSAPTSWAFEIMIALCGIQYCLAAGNTHRLGRHIRIEAVYVLFPIRIRRVFDLLSEAIVTAVLITIVYGSGVQASKALSAWQTTGTSFNSPAPTFMKVAITVGAFLILIQSLVKLRTAFLNLRQGPTQ